MIMYDKEMRKSHETNSISNSTNCDLFFIISPVNLVTISPLTIHAADYSVVISVPTLSF